MKGVCSCFSDNRPKCAFTEREYEVVLTSGFPKADDHRRECDTLAKRHKKKEVRVNVGI